MGVFNPRHLWTFDKFNVTAAWLYKLSLVESKMNTGHLVLLEKSVDLMILGSFLDPFYSQHSVTANFLHKIYSDIFKEKNTPACVYEIHYKYSYFSPERTFQSCLVISRSKNKDKPSEILVDGMYVNSIGIRISFSGEFFRRTQISLTEFNKIENKTEYLNGIIADNQWPV